MNTTAQSTKPTEATNDWLEQAVKQCFDAKKSPYLSAASEAESEAHSIQHNASEHKLWKALSHTAHGQKIIKILESRHASNKAKKQNLERALKQTEAKEKQAQENDQEWDRIKQHLSIHNILMDIERLENELNALYEQAHKQTQTFAAHMNMAAQTIDEAVQEICNNQQVSEAQKFLLKDDQLTLSKDIDKFSAIQASFLLQLKSVQDNPSPEARTQLNDTIQDLYKAAKQYVEHLDNFIKDLKKTAPLSDKAKELIETLTQQKDKLIECGKAFEATANTTNITHKKLLESIDIVREISATKNDLMNNAGLSQGQKDLTQSAINQVNGLSEHAHSKVKELEEQLTQLKAQKAQAQTELQKTEETLHTIEKHINENAIDHTIKNAGGYWKFTLQNMTNHYLENPEDKHLTIEIGGQDSIIFESVKGDQTNYYFYKNNDLTAQPIEITDHNKIAEITHKFWQDGSKPFGNQTRFGHKGSRFAVGLETYTAKHVTAKDAQIETQHHEELTTKSIEIIDQKIETAQQAIDFESFKETHTSEFSAFKQQRGPSLSGTFQNACNSEAHNCEAKNDVLNPDSLYEIARTGMKLNR